MALLNMLSCCHVRTRANCCESLQGLRLQHDVPQRRRIIHGDEQAVKRIVINLVRYIKYIMFTIITAQCYSYCSDTEHASAHTADIYGFTAVQCYQRTHLCCMLFVAMQLHNMYHKV
jgi:hypothetical protein